MRSPARRGLCRTARAVAALFCATVPATTVAASPADPTAPALLSQLQIAGSYTVSVAMAPVEGDSGTSWREGMLPLWVHGGEMHVPVLGHLSELAAIALDWSGDGRAEATEALAVGDTVDFEDVSIKRLTGNAESGTPRFRVSRRRSAGGGTDLSSRPVRLASGLRSLGNSGAPAPELTGVTIDGQRMGLRDYRGSVVLLHFWATWCGYCRAEIPDLKVIFRRYQQRGFRILGISRDRDEQSLRRFVQANAMPWPQLLARDGQEHIAASYNLQAVPTMFLVDPQGNFMGGGRIHGMEALRQMLARVFAE
ncbi:MAG: TlpA family protein disulfide reductase [Candidatus Schekmanbacteria bacterium]|nr:TlpA family protein disulfide reductase [Candidatus Schekmanbacteria bacterium]